MFYFHKDGTLPPKDDGWVLVFGSNQSGIHGKGAAKEALDNWGAEWKNGVGRQGQSYAIPTKDHHIQTLPLGWIGIYVRQFVIYAEEHPDINFWITRVGCGLAGLKDRDMAPMFETNAKNCNFPEEWARWLS